MTVQECCEVFLLLFENILIISQKDRIHNTRHGIQTRTVSSKQKVKSGSDSVFQEIFQSLSQKLKSKQIEKNYTFIDLIKI